ncbi:GPP34 family phosphoprotein [Streptomyces sp. SCSIO 30461]|uniref:GOLPH3/VPS74 family protein n=1 Tax=Streptomyces sp. SCSIO 30461 TaxID=3118085 RepID=UPI0030CD58DC
MTTARDLMIIALHTEPGRSVEHGDFSLAVAGAEVIDLIRAGAVALDGDRIVPGTPTAHGDSLQDQAAESVVRERPYESVDDWLWRRGRGLSTAYLAALEADGLLSRPRRRGLTFRSRRVEPADSPALRDALGRWVSGEPVLVALATAVRIRREGTADHAGAGADADADAQAEPESGADVPSTGDDAVDTVLAAVYGSLTELEALRQRRAIEQAAFDNVWRGE